MTKYSTFRDFISSSNFSYDFRLKCFLAMWYHALVQSVLYHLFFCCVYQLAIVEPPINEILHSSRSIGNQAAMQYYDNKTFPRFTTQ